MIAELKPYPAMKDSGVEWLGEVPKHWDVLPNRTFFAEVKERGHPAEQMLSVTITKGVIPQRTLLADSSKKDSSNQDKSAYKLVLPSDIAYNKMRAWQGAVGVSDYQGIVSPAYVVERPREGANSRYLHYLLRTPAFAKEAERWSYGITSDMWSLRPEHFKMIYGCLPPLPEQSAIVRYLDHADWRIRRYIRAKQKLITLLEEQKQALIHQAVTGRIDVRTGRPYPAYKPSGVEWLEEVPEHWNLVPLKWASHRSQNGVTPPTSESRFYEDGEIPWYGPSSCGTKEEIGAPVRHLNPITFSEGAARLVRGPAILIVVIGTAGRMALMSDDGSTNQQITAFEFSRDLVSPVFLLRQLRSAESWLRATASTATIPILDSGVVARLPCAMPPMEEQGVINRDLDSHVSRIDPVIVRYLTEISLLREYRTRLIADVVTGKLDVREAAARLPDEVEEPEPFDKTGALIDGEEEASDGFDNTSEEAVV